jgi:hypothetical protein
MGGKVRRKETTRKAKTYKDESQEIGWGDVDWIDLTRDRDKWRALVNTVMNLWVP